MFDGWRDALPDSRKYLPAARDYLAASLWRRLGLRINETVMLDVADWHPELGPHGKLHVRHGKGSRGRGAKVRIVPAIDDVDALLEWWLTDVRHQFGDDYDDPAAPLLPSERRDRLSGHCTRLGTEALRTGLADAVERWLPDWSRRLTPHVLRHYCASHLYQQGMTLKAIQELMGIVRVFRPGAGCKMHPHIDRQAAGFPRLTGAAERAACSFQPGAPPARPAARQARTG